MISFSSKTQQGTHNKWKNQLQRKGLSLRSCKCLHLHLHHHHHHCLSLCIGFIDIFNQSPQHLLFFLGGTCRYSSSSPQWLQSIIKTHSPTNKSSSTPTFLLHHFAFNMHICHHTLRH